MKLKNRTAIVTGAGQGIGRAIALAFAKEGADVAIADINLQTANKVADEIRALGRKAIAIQVDVTKRNDVNRMAEVVMQNFTKIDILVNNAGILKPSSMEDLSEEDWDRVINVNLKGPFLCSQAVGRHMIKQRSGNIVNIASISGKIPELLSGSYCPSKAGVISLTEVLAMEWAKYNIRVNAISPGVTWTPLEEKVYTSEEAIKERSKLVPLQRMGQPEEIAMVAVFLASDDSSYITGETIDVDGGQMRSLYNLIVHTQLGLKR